MDIRERFKRWSKLRFAIIYPFGVFVVLFCNSNHDSFKASIKYIIIGMLIRIWANGYAIKMEKLTTSGPYAFVRHPLYIGTLFIAIGFAIMLRTSYAGVLFITITAIIYYRTIQKEEEMLQNKFKDVYISYKNKVPAIIPKISSYRDGDQWSFSFKRLIRSKEYKTFFLDDNSCYSLPLKRRFYDRAGFYEYKNVGIGHCGFSLGSD